MVELDPKFWLDLVQWVFMGGLAVIMWARKPGEDATRSMQNVLVEMARVQERLSQHESRILNSLETQERRLERMETFFMETFKGDGK
jgi:hypothetical protein